MAYHLFEVTGVELEYMIVDRKTLSVKPIADELIKDVTGDYVSDVDRSPIGWSNELVSHVIELKTNGPARSLDGLAEAFHQEVRDINARLKPMGAMLMPTGAHPFMDPAAETVIWPHEYNEVYELYNRIFDCRGHGWSNLQSLHLNLPFANDEEFGRLHAAIRLVLPLIPALCASTPIIDGALTGFADTRLEYYRHNQVKMPSLGGKIIPEPVFSQQEYHDAIFAPIIRDVKPFDTNGVLDYHFLNSRGAIARFDRMAIEIRLIDIQECPKADIAITDLIVQVLKALTFERWATTAKQQRWMCDPLAGLLLTTIRHGSKAEMEIPGYNAMFGLTGDIVRPWQLWQYFFQTLQSELLPESVVVLQQIIDRGNLSDRIFQLLPEYPDKKEIDSVYLRLTKSLTQNTLLL